jgi:hypothetical protein
MIEARAKIRLADEYDAAQERGEMSTGQEYLMKGDASPGIDAVRCRASDVGLSADDVYEACEYRDGLKT